MEFNATFLVSAISFIVFTFVMNKIFYNPLGRVISKDRSFWMKPEMMLCFQTIRLKLF